MFDILRKIKRTIIYEFFINYLFYPIYHFLWKNIFNLKARILYLTFKKDDDFFNLNKNDKILIKDNPEFQNLALKIKKEAIDKIPLLKEKILSENYRNELKNSNRSFADIPYSIEFYDQLSDELKKEIVKFASSKKMILTAANYMGIFPMITRIQVSLNIPRKNTSARSAMLWHKDAFGFKNLDFFMAVSDIDEESGPFHCLEEKIKASVFKNFQYKKNRQGERGKVNSLEFDKVFSQNNYISLIGKPGTAFFLDSFATFHKGGFCKSKDRLVFRICYQSQDVLSDSYKRNDKYFLFDKSILKNELNNKHKEYLFFNSPSTVMKYLSKFLLKFFSIIEFKY